MFLRKIDSVLWSLWLWLDDWLPAQCFRCRRWTRGGDQFVVQHRIQGYVKVCPHCKKDLGEFLSL